MRLGTTVMLRRGFQALRLGTALVAMISLTPGVWSLLSDDLSSVIFGQSTGTSALRKYYSLNIKI